MQHWMKSWKCKSSRLRGRVTYWVNSRVEKENNTDQLFCICLSLDTYAHTHTSTANVLDPALFYARAYLRVGDKSSTWACAHRSRFEKYKEQRNCHIESDYWSIKFGIVPPAVAKPWYFRERQPSKSAEHLARSIGGGGKNIHPNPCRQ